MCQLISRVKNDKSTFNFCKADHFKEKNKIIKSCYN